MTEDTPKTRSGWPVVVSDPRPWPVNPTQHWEGWQRGAVTPVVLGRVGAAGPGCAGCGRGQDGQPWLALGGSPGCDGQRPRKFVKDRSEWGGLKLA